jgi:hypothetical protein
MKALLIILLTGLCIFSNAQTTNESKLFPGIEDSTKSEEKNKEKIKSIDLDFQGKQGELKVNKDDRIQTLTEFSGTPQKNEPSVKVKGFRVQVFFDPDKDQVNQKRADYLSRHAENPAYVDYLQPNFRLRVGNFRTKLQAQAWQDELKNDFPDAIIVEDWIELPALKKESK